MKQNKTSNMVELNEDELSSVSGGDGSGNSNLLWGAGGLALGAGAMMLRKPTVVVQTAERLTPHHFISPEDQKLFDKVGEVKNIKQMPHLNKPLSKESPF